MFDEIVCCLCQEPSNWSACDQGALVGPAGAKVYTGSYPSVAKTTTAVATHTAGRSSDCLCALAACISSERDEREQMPPILVRCVRSGEMSPATFIRQRQEKYTYLPGVCRNTTDLYVMKGSLRLTAQGETPKTRPVYLEVRVERTQQAGQASMACCAVCRHEYRC